MSDFKKLRVPVEHDGAVLRVVLNAPKANVLDSAMMAEIRQALRAQADNHRLKLVLFEGQGDHFSFGASVPEHVRDQVPGMLRRFHELVLELCRFPAVTGALVRGECLGGGFELALCCDWIVAERGARFALPEISLAVFPPAGAALLPRRVPGGRAADWVLSGRRVEANEAHATGLVRALADKGQGEATLQALIQSDILPRSAAALRCAVRAVRRHLLRDLDTDLQALEQSYVQDLMATRDANEGIAAFLEKRAPRFVDQ